MRRLIALVLPLLVAAACSEPPHKELDRAEGAIEAARAAGAEQYASESFAAATSAFQQANDAVAQNDYRLALTRALDAYSRAQQAARGAADGKARARSEAEAAIAAATGTLNQLTERLKTHAGNLPRREAAAARTAQADTTAALQKARAALSTGAYLDAKAAAEDLTTRIAAQIKEIDAAAAAKPAKPARRRR